MASIDFESLSDVEIRNKLIELGEPNVGPVNSRTRKVHLKKLKALLGNQLNKAAKNKKTFDKYDPKNISHSSLNDSVLDISNSSGGYSPLKRRKSIIRGQNDSLTQSINEGHTLVKRQRRGRISMRTEPMETEPEESEETSFWETPQKMKKSNGSTPSSSVIESDENQDFGNLVAKKLRKYDDAIQNIIQNEIMSIFIKADAGYYQHS